MKPSLVIIVVQGTPMSSLQRFGTLYRIALAVVAFVVAAVLTYYLLGECLRERKPDDLVFVPEAPIVIEEGVVLDLLYDMQSEAVSNSAPPFSPCPTVVRENPSPR